MLLRPGGSSENAAVLSLPDGLELGDYPAVDISVEQLDGNPAHSGVSVARGPLQRP